MLPIARALLRLTLVGLFASSLSFAFQTDVYVDAVGGDDANSGLSQSDAFRTLTAATTAFSSGTVEFVVAPGLYDAALGETFPIEIRNGATIRHYPFPGNRPTVYGAASGPRPVIDAGGAPLAMRMGGEDDLAPWKGSYNIVIQNAELGLLIRGVGGFYFGRGITGFSFLDCDIGLDIIQDPTGELTYIGGSHCTFERCRIGARAAGRTNAGFSSSTFHDVSAAGVVVGDVNRFDLWHCSFVGCATGVVLDATASSSVANTVATLAGVTFAQCRRGLQLREAVPGRLTLSGTRLTFADNAIGLETLPSPSGLGFSSATLTGSIFANNGTGIELGQDLLAVSESVAYQSGAISGSQMVSFDPEFRDPAAGDYRLKPSSPAIDSFLGPSAFPLEELDGDLDLVAQADFGAHEFTPLGRVLPVIDRGRGPARLGETLALDVVGTPGATILGLVQPGFVVAGVSTIYGDLRLDPDRLVRDVVRLVDPATGFASWPVVIPGDPVLAGTKLNLQALSRTSSASAGAAFTNAIYLTLTP